MKGEVGGSGRYPDKFISLVHMRSFLSRKKNIQMTSIFVPEVHFSQHFKRTTTPNALQI